MEDKLEQIAHDFVAEFCGGSETVEDILYARLSALAAPAVAETGTLIAVIERLREQANEMESPYYTKTPAEPDWDWAAKAFRQIADELAALAAQAPQVAETGRTAIDEAQAYMLDRCLEVIRGEVPREAFTAADLAVSEALAAAQAPKPSTGARTYEQGVLDEHKSHIDFENELYATLVDPIAEGSIKEAEIRKQLLESARWYRQHTHDLETQLNAKIAAPASLSTGRLEGLIVKWRKRLDLERTVPMRYAFDLCISELEAALKEQGAAPSLESLRAEVRGGQEQRTCWYGNNTSCPYGATAEQPSPAEES